MLESYFVVVEDLVIMLAYPAQFVVTIAHKKKKKKKKKRLQN